MANFELDPTRLVPTGHQIIDGGPRCLPRTFVTLAASVACHHEQYLVAEVMPAPTANQIGQVSHQVVDLFNNWGFHVRSAQTWILGVGLFELINAREMKDRVFVLLVVFVKDISYFWEFRLICATRKI